MNNFNFGEALTCAWKTIWKHEIMQLASPKVAAPVMIEINA
jgi:hypothetical protein